MIPTDSIDHPDSKTESFLSRYDSECVLAEKDGMEYTVSRKMSDQEVTYLHQEVIEKGFANINAITQERQDMTAEEFAGDAEARNVLKFLARHEGNPIAVLTVHVGLERVVWTDSDSVAKLQNHIDENSPPMYIGTIVVDPNHPGIDRAGAELIHQALLEYQAHVLEEGMKSGIFFDCAWANVPFIPRLVASALRKAQVGRDDLRLIEWYKDEDDELTVELLNLKKNGSPADGHHSYAVVPAEVFD